MYAGTLLEIAMSHADNIIIRAKKGEADAYSQLVNLWYKRIYNYALKYLGDHDEAMDVTQKTFIVMYKKLSQLSDINKFRPWLYRIAANSCHEEFRRKNRHNHLFVSSKRRDKDELPTQQDYSESPAIEAQLQQKALNKLLQGALQQLTEEQREVIILKEYEGLKFREIAEVLEISENTVKSRLYYALNHLKQFMEERQLTKEILYYEA